MIQNKINKRSGRKCQDFDEAEKEYQTAQEEWKEDENNLKAWQKMFSLMSTAVFNICNKKLEYILDKEEIEERALDITCVIMAGIKKKRDTNQPWEISKVSSYAYLPCLAIYKKQLQFDDQLLGQDEIEPDESDMDDGFYHNVKTDWEYKEGYGYYE